MTLFLLSFTVLRLLISLIAIKLSLLLRVLELLDVYKYSFNLLAELFWEAQL